MDTLDFKEDLLRLYLGKYESHFKPVVIDDRNGIVLYTDPHPLLVVSLLPWRWVSLVEYIEIENEDPHHGAFDYYQIDIIRVPLEDPEGVRKVEKAIARSFLTGTQS